MTLKILPGWTRYQSEKIVEAAPIEAVEGEHKSGKRYVLFEDGSYLLVEEAVFKRGEPEKGDLLVRYADGYISWSPRKAFEDGYVAILDEPIPAEAETVPLGPDFHAQAGVTHGHLHDVYTTRDVGENRRIHVGQLTRDAVNAWREATDKA